jgi:hypothetical protein
VRRVEGDQLAGVLITLSDFETDPPYEPATHELFIRDCRLTPALVVATRGDHIRLANETDYPFLPELGTGMLRAVLRGAPQDIELGEAGIRYLECGFAASCGRTVVVTLHHPLHATTDEGGRFRIEDVPLGDELKVSAWHPLFQEAHRLVTVRAGEGPADEVATVELVLTPAPSGAAGPPEGTPEPSPGEGGPATVPAENDPANELF